MSTSASLFPVAVTGLTALALAAAIAMSADFARAAEQNADNAEAPGCRCPKSDSIKPKLADLRPELDQNDEFAALESVQFALTEVADGSSYVWRRTHGRLSGIVNPIASFKDTRGAVCRYAVIVLSSIDRTKRTEIVACRLPTGVWQLEG